MEAEDEARRTLSGLVRLVREENWQQAQDLLDLVRARGKNLAPLSPSANVVRRVLRLIRDEYASAYWGRQVEADRDSLQKLLSARDDSVSDYTRPLPELRERLLDSLDELERESRAVEEFLKRAAQHKRTFQVLVAEGGPHCEGVLLAESLAREGIATTLVPDSAVFALMPRVSKVILGTDSVLCRRRPPGREAVHAYFVPFCFWWAVDGVQMAFHAQVIAHHVDCVVKFNTNLGLSGARIEDSTMEWLLRIGHKMRRPCDLAPCGSHALALAARHCAVPLLVCAPGATLTPQLPCSESTYQQMGSPEPLGPEPRSGKALLLNPTSDIVPPDLVPLLVTSAGGHAPSYVYRLLSEVYHPDDHSLTASS
ncbi:hypothetical protein HPB48_020457 [Haemaphysalis longicornis]|uniref:Translation initiation factor eIF2B subunit beta n=1 Tax=Haemaphysalis longicornis TaxID=44386 RepID=A0A9J6FLM9_HAELO|nr:hypothetical protein HPB48_020457 [Haemaphysalis longicornis]